MRRSGWKRMTVGALAVSAVSLALAGCAGGGQAGENQGKDQLARILEKGEIVVAMEGTWSPWTYHDESDALVGYDVEVAGLIGEKLGVKVTFVEGEWDGLFAGLDAGRYDLVVNGVEVTPEREEKYDFTDPYAFIRTAIVVDGENEAALGTDRCHAECRADLL